MEQVDLARIPVWAAQWPLVLPLSAFVIAVKLGVGRRYWGFVPGFSSFCVLARCGGCDPRGALEATAELTVVPAGAAVLATQRGVRRTRRWDAGQRGTVQAEGRPGAGASGIRPHSESGGGWAFDVRAFKERAG